MDYFKILNRYRDMEIEVLNSLDLDSVNDVLNLLEQARLSGKRIFVCGNGGSASTASHYASDFNKGINVALAGIGPNTLLDESAQGTGSLYPILMANQLNDRKVPLYDFECLSDNIPTLLAIANDESYEEVFRFQLAVKMKQGDVVIGISASGNSSNVINALTYASENGGKTVAIVGFDGGRMKRIADCCIHVKINDMQITEDIHMVLDHMMMWVLTHKENAHGD